ncbi:UNVERIFIED_CONTAM: hypothetical protein K0B97_09050 [Spiribacter pallidus]
MIKPYLSAHTSADDLTGTDGDDTFNAQAENASGTSASTFTFGDSIEGGEGTDTLNVYTTGQTNENFSFPSNASVSGVEVVNYVVSGAAAPNAIDASDFEGVEQIWQFGTANSVSQVGNSTTVGFSGNSDLDLRPGNAGTDSAGAYQTVSGGSIASATAATFTGTFRKRRAGFRRYG